MWTLLVLSALVFAGCAAGGGASQPSSSKSSGGQQVALTTGSSEQGAQGAGPSGQASEERLGHPELGSAKAPVVLVEYSDYQ